MMSKLYEEIQKRCFDIIYPELNEPAYAWIAFMGFALTFELRHILLALHKLDWFSWIVPTAEWYAIDAWSYIEFDLSKPIKEQDEEVLSNILQLFQDE